MSSSSLRLPALRLSGHFTSRNRHKVRRVFHTKLFSTRARYEVPQKIDHKPETGEILTGIRVSAVDWEGDGVCDLVFPEEDEEAFRNAPVFTRKIHPYETWEKPVQTVYNFYALNKQEKKPYRTDEDSFLSKVFGTDEEHVSAAKAIERANNGEDGPQQFVFENTLPGDYIALRVEDPLNIKLTNNEKWVLKQKMLKSESYRPQQSALSYIGTTVESEYRVDPMCPHFNDGCSGCIVQTLRLDQQLEQKRQLVVRMLWAAHGLSEAEKEVRIEFLEDLRRLTLTDVYRPVNVHEICARYEYDNRLYNKDRFFLEKRSMSFEEADDLVDEVLVSNSLASSAYLQVFPTKSNDIGIGYRFRFSPNEGLPISNCPKAAPIVRKSMAEFYRVYRRYSSRIQPVSQHRRSGDLSGFHILATPAASPEFEAVLSPFAVVKLSKTLADFVRLEETEHRNVNSQFSIWEFDCGMQVPSTTIFESMKEIFQSVAVSPSQPHLQQLESSFSETRSPSKMILALGNISHPTTLARFLSFASFHPQLPEEEKHRERVTVEILRNEAIKSELHFLFPHEQQRFNDTPVDSKISSFNTNEDRQSDDVKQEKPTLIHPSVIVLHHSYEGQYSQDWYKILLQTITPPLPSIVLLSSAPRYLESDIRHIRRMAYSVTSVKVFDGGPHRLDLFVMVIMKPKG